MKLALFWFRRDLRITDNAGLTAAHARAERILPVFILEPGPETPRRKFALESLSALRAALAGLGHTLITRSGKPELVLCELIKESDAEAVFCNKQYEPDALLRDERVFNSLNAIGVGFEQYKDAVVWEEREIVTGVGNPYTVFTPYSKAWSARPIPKPFPKLGPSRFPVPIQMSENLDIGSSGGISGANAAHKCLEEFVSRRLAGYASNRDFPALNGTSQLSPHLACGTIGIRMILAAVSAFARKHPEAVRDCETFRKELIWREFYIQILANFPHVAERSFRPEFDRVKWENQTALFDAWKAGQTGYPIVDAAMRCLNQTGWMHNRLRMIVAMFLCKDLLVTWHWGEQYFMDKLADGDLAANNGGWQWSAGTGTDAAPYFRIFNPITQSRKFDPDGEFIRRWVPELRDLYNPDIHEPWKVAPVRDYPPRIVIHEEQRGKALAMYAAAKSGPPGR